MNISLLTLFYLIASISFIVGLKMLSNPKSAKAGNLVAAAGMTLAIFATIFYMRAMVSGFITMPGFLEP